MRNRDQCTLGLSSSPGRRVLHDRHDGVDELDGAQGVERGRLPVYGVDEVERDVGGLVVGQDGAGALAEEAEGDGADPVLGRVERADLPGEAIGDGDAVRRPLHGEVQVVGEGQVDVRMQGVLQSVLGQLDDRVRQLQVPRWDLAEHLREIAGPARLDRDEDLVDDCCVDQVPAFAPVADALTQDDGLRPGLIRGEDDAGVEYLLHGPHGCP